MSIETNIYVSLSVAMFLQYAIWGAWAPVLAARLLGPLRLSGKQTGWIYATLPLACLVAPLVSGQLADKYFDVKWILLVAQLAGAILLFVAGRTTKFGRLFLVMLLYSLCYAATLPLVNAVLFRHVKDVSTQGMVFIWAPIAWALVGYFLSGWRMLRRGEGDGGDCLTLAAVLSAIMAASCAILPATPPAQIGGEPLVGALSKLAQGDFLVFFLTSIFVSGTMQFYFLGTAPFMMNLGISGKAVPASMAGAQVAQAIATYFALGFFLAKFGFQGTLAIGAAAWLLLYAVYVLGKPRWLIVVAQPLHGFAYVMFIIVGQIFAGAVGADAPSSMQALIFMATVGVGLFAGTQAAGFMMDHFSVSGQFQWRKIWMAPLIVVLLGVLTTATIFRGVVPEAKSVTPTAMQTSTPPK